MEAIRRSFAGTLSNLDAPSIKTAQTAARLMRLRQEMTGKAIDADALVQKALAGATAKAMQGVTVNTAGNLGHAVSLTMDTGHSLDFANKRWGIAGINYMSNLVAAGQADVAAILPSLPTYSKSAVVAAKNMSGMALNEKGLNAQLQALAADLNNPFMVHNASARAMRQAAEARVADLTEAGALPQIAAAQKNVDSARQTALDAQAALSKASRNAQGARAALMAAQAAFDQKPADTAAMDAVMDAIGSMENANQADAQARLAYQSNQKALTEAQTKLDDVQHKTLASVQAQVKQEIAELRLKQERAGLNRQTVWDKLLSGFVATARAAEKVETRTKENMRIGQSSPENVSIDGNLAGNDDSPLAPNNGSDIISEGAQAEYGDRDTGLLAQAKIEFLKPPKPASLSDAETRRWYLDAEARIPELIDRAKPLEQQARQAFELRNMFRAQAREAMSNRSAAQGLDITDPNKTWEQIVDKYQRKGFTGDALYAEIINASTRSRTAINESLGIFPK